ncbi:MAG: serine/threonine protein kinase [Verrucomicrobiales bacterium]|nr:serine/threonine protein kinase [Verrucomicrobiales bacterium]
MLIRWIVRGRRCGECGGWVPTDRLEQLCPACLARLALGQWLEGPVGSESRGSLAAYEVLDEIAVGGMGMVFRAQHQPSKRFVALKVMAGPRLGDPRATRRFDAEVEAVARLKHANIMEIRDFGQVDGLPFYVMDLAEGGTLSHRIHSQPPPPRQTARWLRDIAGGVHYAHQQCVLHRDLKPSNILLDAQGRPKIADFGIAGFLRGQFDDFPPGHVLGSPCYMSPEQAAGRWREVGVASDVYGLGAILYEALTGRPPFGARTVAATLRQVVELLPIPPLELHPETPGELENMCLKCLEKDPASRYPSARDLADDLGRFLRSRESPGHRRGSSSRPQRAS